MEYQYIGKLNIKPLEDEFGFLTTDELILTQERDNHIKDRHEADYNLFHKCVFDVISLPDFILKDAKNKNTVMYIKYIEETNVNIVIRLSLQTECSNYKNSIITSYRVGAKNLKRFIKNNKILYKKE